VLTATTGAAGFVTFLRDGLGVITPIIGNPAISMMMSLELAGIGFGMLVPLSVGLSGLLGVWFISVFGEKVAALVALNGTAPEHWEQCQTILSQGEVTEFLTANCGKAAEMLGAGSHFKYIVQWMMWPATSMMVMAALTSVVLPLIVNAIVRRRGTDEQTEADEHISNAWTWGGIVACVAVLVWLQDAWFSMPWYQVLVAVAIQPVLIIAGLRVLGITGQGPVSLMANATQFVFGLFWPGHIQQNLVAAHVAADPQASSEATMASFWVARRLGGNFRALIMAQLLMIPIGAIVTPIMFNLLSQTYGVGPDPGQLSAPTGLKIASLAIVMEKGLAALPHGARVASIVAAALGVVLELLLAMRRRHVNGTHSQRFPWLPIPSAFGFALILPPAITIAIAVGSVISAFWRKFSSRPEGSYAQLGAPLAAGLIAGEAMVAGILLPFLAFVLELL
jgi:hypothetical protein